MSAKPKFRVVNQGDGSAEIDLYGVIGWEVSPVNFRRELKGLGDVSTIDLHIHSNGGDVIDGLAIYNMLKKHPAKVIAHVDGAAISMAATVAMAGDEIEMADHSLMMIHNPMAGAYGEADDLRHTAGLLDTCKNQLADIYAERTGLDREQIDQLMDDETWLEAGRGLPPRFCRPNFLSACARSVL